jgi:UDP-N-acetylmuramate dehydrogenase
LPRAINDAAKGPGSRLGQALPGQALRRFEQAELRTRNTFGVAALAPLLVEVGDATELPRAFAPGWAGADAMVLGGGSNVLFAADPPFALVALTGSRTAIVRDEGDTAIVRAEAGAAWHPFVLWTLDQGLSGLQNLALIPGTVGAAPIQNIGAYGAEVGECVHAVEAFERASGRVHRLDRGACEFAYRDSLFKRDPDAWIVTAVEFELTRTPRLVLDYAGIADELAAMRVDQPTPRQVADAVVRIRRHKLPDPAVIGNAGSFFKNPIVDADLAASMLAEHPDLPVFRGDRADTRKLSAAWLIDRCGWKGHREGDAGISDRHALVLVNHGGASGAQLLDLARRVAASVHERFGVPLEPEPRIVGATW